MWSRPIINYCIQLSSTPYTGDSLSGVGRGQCQKYGRSEWSLFELVRGQRGRERGTETETERAGEREGERKSDANVRGQI